MKSLGINIVVLDGGFVFIGYIHIEDGNVLISKAHNIRRWGTSKGLGELQNGPTKDTVYDPSGEVVVPSSRVIFYQHVEESKWQKLLK